LNVPDFRSIRPDPNEAGTPNSENDQSLDASYLRNVNWFRDLAGAYDRDAEPGERSLVWGSFLVGKMTPRSGRKGGFLENAGVFFGSNGEVLNIDASEIKDYKS
jgi:hypothetical protein